MRLLRPTAQAKTALCRYCLAPLSRSSRPGTRLHQSTASGIALPSDRSAWLTAPQLQGTARPPGRRLQHGLLQRRGFRTSVISMSLQTGIVGMPNVGKSTLFNAVCDSARAQAGNFPFCTIEPNVGLVAVPDERLETLSTLSKSRKTVPTSVEFVDIAGLVKGASEGQGLGNKFLANIRECDSIVQVIRCFEDDNVHHVNGKVDPVGDADTINFELALADITQIEKRMQRLVKGGRKSKEEVAAGEVEAAALQRILDALDQNKPARAVELNDDEAAAVKSLYLLTMKPLIYAANVAEDMLADLGATDKHVQVAVRFTAVVTPPAFVPLVATCKLMGSATSSLAAKTGRASAVVQLRLCSYTRPLLQALRRKAEEDGCEVIIVSAQVEAELRDLEPADAAEYLESLGVEEGGLRSLIQATYKQLGLYTYFTTGEQETRAWTIKAGMTAPQAAGVIHTDFERGFIRAETVAYSAFVEAGGFSQARDKGQLRLEGKEYIVNEGDVMLFRFNV